MMTKRGANSVNWSLRLGLGGALLVLVTVASVVASTPFSVAKALSSPTTTVVTNPTATATVPGAVSGKVSIDHASRGCGFTLPAPVPNKTTRQVSKATRAPSPGHCTVLEIGDSIGNDLGWGIQRHVSPTSGVTFVQRDRSSSGLSNFQFYDWPNQLGSLLRQYHPQLVLVCLGADDEQGMTINGSAVAFGSPGWKRNYLAEVRSIVHQATTSGAYVLWVGLPNMASPTFAQGIETINALFEQGVTSQMNATYVSMWSLFSNPQGGYSSSAKVNGAESALRDSDGIHLSFVGEEVAATYMLREMALIYHVTLTPTMPSVVSSWS